MWLALWLTAVGASAFAQSPGRYLEWRRASAPAVYVATVTDVRQVGASEGTGAGPRMEAAVKVDAVLRAPAGAAAADTALRYEEPGDEPRGGVFYRLRPGERVLVFGNSLGREYPLEVISGTLSEVRRQVTALKDAAARMDEPALELHGVDARARDAQVKLYDAALAALR